MYSIASLTKYKVTGGSQISHMQPVAHDEQGNGCVDVTNVDFVALGGEDLTVLLGLIYDPTTKQFNDVPA